MKDDDEPAAGNAQGSADAALTPIEEILGDLWREILKVEQVNIHENFFDRGGTSLTAMIFLIRVQEELGIPLTFEAFMKSAVLKDIAAEAEQLLISESNPALYKELENLPANEVQTLLEQERGASP